jgi:hypothetical protein
LSREKFPATSYELSVVSCPISHGSVEQQVGALAVLDRGLPETSFAWESCLLQNANRSRVPSKETDLQSMQLEGAKAYAVMDVTVAVANPRPQNLPPSQ